MVSQWVNYQNLKTVQATRVSSLSASSSKGGGAAAAATATDLQKGRQTADGRARADGIIDRLRLASRRLLLSDIFALQCVFRGLNTALKLQTLSWTLGACTYDVCTIFGIFDPLPPPLCLVCILDKFIVLNSRNLPYSICFWGTPLSPPTADIKCKCPLLQVIGIWINIYYEAYWYRIVDKEH